jgi:hypothetical protein
LAAFACSHTGAKTAFAKFFNLALTMIFQNYSPVKLSSVFHCSLDTHPATMPELADYTRYCRQFKRLVEPESR